MSERSTTPATTLIGFSVLSVLALASLMFALSSRSRLDDVEARNAVLEKKLARLDERVARVSKSSEASRENKSARTAKRKSTAKRSDNPTRRAATTERASASAKRVNAAIEPTTGPADVGDRGDDAEEAPPKPVLTPVWSGLVRMTDAAAKNFESVRGSVIQESEENATALYQCRQSVPGVQAATVFLAPSEVWCELVLHKAPSQDEASGKLIEFLESLDADLPEDWFGRNERAGDLTDVVGYATSEQDKSFRVGLRAPDEGEGMWVVIRIDGTGE